LSHQAVDAPCQDRCAGAVLTSRHGQEVFITVVSDGAGSAAYAERGAQSVCDSLLELAANELRNAGELEHVGNESVRVWFLTARERLRVLAREAGSDVREFAATALLAIAGDRQTLCARIGDGAIVVRRAPGAAFEVALWPDAGEYTNQTYFITDETAAEHIAIARFDDVCDVVAFSDGLQHLALEQATRTAFGPFFAPLVETVRGADRANGRLRAALLDFLNSAPINERTDDDKSLVVGCRMVPA
jgi:hypothetical protein